MKKILFFAAFLASAPALADERTLEIVTSNGLIQAVVNGVVQTLPPAGMTFIVVDSSSPCQAGWTYNISNGTCSPPPSQ